MTVEELPNINLMYGRLVPTKVGLALLLPTSKRIDPSAVTVTWDGCTQLFWPVTPLNFYQPLVKDPNFTCLVLAFPLRKSQKH